jgi:hypothetical protein
MFAFFSNRLGCLGSLFVSVIGTIILLEYFAVAARTGKFVCESKTGGRATEDANVECAAGGLR